MKITRYKVLLIAAALALVSVAALAIDLGDLLKIAGIGALVSEFRGPLDKTINEALKERGAEAMGATKVVPIFSIGQGAFIGAAQVVGVPDAVKKVQAVAQIEIAIGSGHANAFIPVSTKQPSKEPEKLRVKNVGVSAIIDIRV
jgi:hypothetical protein